MSQHLVIAVDGPSASGKSTVARELARALGFCYVDTGAMYRAATWEVLQRGIDPNDTEAVVRCVKNSELTARIEDNTTVLYLRDRLSQEALRSPQVNAHVSEIASIPGVREILVAKQRALADHAPLVMEGRDIGTAVFPNTPYKYYLDADPAVREARRSGQGGGDLIHHRDAKDSTRPVAPLRIAPDALVVDSTNLSIPQVVAKILHHLRTSGLKVTYRD